MPNPLAWRTMSVLFALPAVYLLVAFVAGVGERQVVGGALALAPVFGAAAVGLWFMRPWGRTLGLLIALANTGLGALGLVAAILADTSPIGAILFGGLNGAIAWTLSREWFGLPGETS